MSGIIQNVENQTPQPEVTVINSVATIISDALIFETARVHGPVSSLAWLISVH